MLNRYDLRSLRSFPSIPCSIQPAFVRFCGQSSDRILVASYVRAPLDNIRSTLDWHVRLQDSFGRKDSYPSPHLPLLLLKDGSMHFVDMSAQQFQASLLPGVAVCALDTCATGQALALADALGNAHLLLAAATGESALYNSAPQPTVFPDQVNWRSSCLRYRTRVFELATLVLRRSISAFLLHCRVLVRIRVRVHT